MSKTVLAQVDGFTPLIDDIIKKLGIMSAAVFGKAWRYCQMPDGVCRASQERLADELGVTRATVNTHMAKLCEAGYLLDTTPDLLGAPHVYADTGKANMSISFTATCQNDLHPPVKKFDTKKEVKKESRNKKTYIDVAPDFRNMSITEVRSIPEIQDFIEATGWAPGTFVLPVVYDAMRSGIDKEALRAAFTAWCARGYKPANVEGYLEWARNGIPEKQSYSKGGKSTMQKDIDTLQKWVKEG